MLRKRKRQVGEVTGATPRATRQRRILDDGKEGDSTVLERTTRSPGTPKALEPLKTPATERRSTRKKNSVTTSQNPTMSTRSRKTILLQSLSDSDVENDLGQSRQTSKPAVSTQEVAGSVVSYVTQSTRSKVKKKAKDTSQGSTEHDSDVENTGKSLLPRQNRPTRKMRILTSADNTIAEIPKTLKTPVKLSTRSRAVTDSTEPETVNKNPLLQLKQPKISTLSGIIETPKKVSAKKNSSSLVQSTADTVTPESSPIPVNLTPHRSSKTPKKSPLNITSPKTHSQSPLKLSRTPRKLTVLVESPATSDKSSVSMFTQSPKENQCVNGEGSTMIDSESPPSFVSVATLQLRKSRDKSGSSATSATLISSSSLTVDDVSVDSSSPKLKSPKKLGVSGSKILESPMKNLGLFKKLEALGTPLANRVSTPSRTPGNSRLSNLIHPKSPKRLRSTTKKSSPVTSLGTPLRPISVARESPEIKLTVGVPKQMNLLLEVNSSILATTPRGRIRRSLHLTPDFTKFSGVSTSSPFPTPQKTASVLPKVFRTAEESQDKSLELLDCNPFVDGTDIPSESGNVQKQKNGTYELSKDDDVAHERDLKVLEKTEVLDITYELTEPKTPNLKQKSRKRSLSNVESSHCTPEAKKRCRVRFATPTQEVRAKSFAVTPGSTRKSLPTTNTPAKQRIGARLSIGVRPSSSKRRSRSLTKIEDKTSSTKAGAKRRSNSTSAFSERTPKLSHTIQSSVNRLSRPRQEVNSEAKSEIKVAVPRKIPNFAQIHQKKFDQMESLVDAKKRVAKRHEELITASPARALPCSSTALNPAAQKAEKPASLAAENSEFTRFGFKLRKVEAVKMMTRKNTVPDRTKNLVDSNKSILKVVRTNRRFELQMKFRQTVKKKNNNNNKKNT